MIKNPQRTPSEFPEDTQRSSRGHPTRTPSGLPEDTPRNSRGHPRRMPIEDINCDDYSWIKTAVEYSWMIIDVVVSCNTVDCS